MILTGTTPYDFQHAPSQFGKPRTDNLGRIREHYRGHPESELLVTLTVDQIGATKEFATQFAKLKTSLLADNQSASEIKHKLFALRAAQLLARHDDGIKPRRPNLDRALSALSADQLREVLND